MEFTAGLNTCLLQSWNTLQHNACRYYYRVPVVSCIASLFRKRSCLIYTSRSQDCTRSLHVMSASMVTICTPISPSLLTFMEVSAVCTVVCNLSMTVLRYSFWSTFLIGLKKNQLDCSDIWMPLIQFLWTETFSKYPENLSVAPCLYLEKPQLPKLKETLSKLSK